MKTKIFTLFLALVACVGNMFAEIKIGDLYYNLDAATQTAEVTSQNSSYPYWSTSITTANIPSSVEYNSVTYSVTSIGDYAFFECTGLTSVEIPNSVTSIGAAAFIYCTGLTSINVASDNLNYCSEDGILFNKDKSILIQYPASKNNTEYDIPYSVTSIGDYAFYVCTGLTSITIPNSVTSIGEAAFCGCTSLTSIEIPNSVTSIEVGAFYDCTGLTSITIPNSVTSIGNAAFYGCSGLTSVTIGNSVTSIEVGAFYDCTGLTSITIPNSVTSIGDGAFWNCTGLTSVTIPNSVTSIGSGAFSACKSLTSITIPNSVTSIEVAAFDGCTGLTLVTIGNSVTSIGDHAFTNCTGLTSVTCMATNPPSMGVDVFFSVDCSKIPLYVPVGSVNTYKSAKQWKDFTNILPISAKDTETTTVKTEPTTNSVEVTWPVVVGAYTYELVIKDKSGNIVCTLIFNAQGQLISIAFNAPGRDGAPQQTQGAGFTFTITGLTAGTSYDVTITAKDSNGATLDTQTVSFTTDGTQGLDDINAATKSQKIVRDNQVLILRGDKMYTVTGLEVK